MASKVGCSDIFITEQGTLTRQYLACSPMWKLHVLAKFVWKDGLP
jgi:hypothetical protein